MTGQPAEVLQVLGRVRAGDPVTATARSLHARLIGQGRSATLAVAERAPGDGPGERFDGARSGQVVVHTADGGEALAPLAAALIGRPLTLVHHGSAVGSDRSTLRALRGSTRRAVAADPAAREELRALGFGAVATLDPRVADDAFRDVTPDAATADNLSRHPGPFLLCVGAIAPNRGLEALIDGFADLLSATHPAAVLSLCGSSSRWYRAWLHRHVTTRGLVACEVVEPAQEGEVLARLDRADAVLSLRPTGLDPYVRAAARRGLPVVAPRSAGTNGLDPGAIVPLPPRAGRAELAAALGEALERPPADGPEPAGDAEVDVVRALGLA